MSSVISITTDFGDTGGYVGIMKGVILGINPDAKLVDLSHSISPQNVLEAQFVLEKAVQYFPEGTTHLAVIDPGVGTARREIVVESESFLCVGPDNGVFTPFLDDADVYEIQEKKYCLQEISSTFHGRDIFASVAAHLSLGVRASDMGPLVSDTVRLTTPPVVVEPHSIAGEVIFVDHFGNLVTNITADMLSSWPHTAIETHIGAHVIGGIVQSYMAPHVPDRTLIALVGSTAHIEIASVNDSAARILGLAAGAPVTIKRN